ncbi:MAG: NAD(P)H-hydrate dehydratase [Clostridia bacterium]|nr:NAD(P)H-hydrate dehydratase [Clostridia bacterium]
MENSKFSYYPYTIYTYDSVDSTNAAAKRCLNMAGTGMDLTVHVAGEQTAGRGRNDRSWITTEDAVLMTIVQGTKLSMDKIPILNLVAAAAVKNALTKLTSKKVDLAIKWPNDVLTAERLEKVCGILSEVITVDGKKFAIIGIGVNLNATSMPDDLLQPATSIFLQYGKYIGVLDAVKEILNEYTVLYKVMMKDREAFLKDFSDSCISVGRHVAVNDGETVRYGIGAKLAPNGQLIVKFEEGPSEVVYAADVSVRNMGVIDEGSARKLLPKRKPAANKGAFGKAALIVGSPKMPGAALLCAKACIRSGAGLTRALIPKELMPSFSAVPEAMLLTDDSEADELIEWASVIGMGCGMGVSRRTKELLEKALRSGKKCVIDADALNTMAKHRELLELLHGNVVITPHPAEMARLVGSTAEDVVKHFSPTAISFAKRYGCCVLLKSATSIIVSPEGVVRYNESGNNGLAKGGSGDVLTGIITAMIAQGAKPFDAASLGSYLLGTSAEKALDFLHNRFIAASDIIDIVSSELIEKEI